MNSTAGSPVIDVTEDAIQVLLDQNFVASHAVLAQHGGVAAVLSRAEPWEPAAVETAKAAAGSA